MRWLFCVMSLVRGAITWRTSGFEFFVPRVSVFFCSEEWRSGGGVVPKNLELEFFVWCFVLVFLFLGT